MITLSKKIIIPVKLAQYENQKLITRSEAKQLLTRITQFETVILDFSGVDFIGQAFADEIFRVFARKNPGIKISAIHTSVEVQQMIRRALSRE